MDYLLLRRCSGNTFCAYSHRLSRGLSLLQGRRAVSGLSRPRPLRLPLKLSRLPTVTAAPTPSRLLATEPEPNVSERRLPSQVQHLLDRMKSDISDALSTRLEPTADSSIRQISEYYFAKGGKLIRPTVVLLMSASVASPSEPLVSSSQAKIALIAEMIHTASLVHDDVIDEAETRRGRPSLNAAFGNRRAVLVGDFILAKATQLLCSLGDPDIIRLLAQVIEDLVKGEFMQMGERDGFDERFSHYMGKTFKKTASLFAHSCQAVAALAPQPDTTQLQRLAFDYGKQLGLAFQLVDDLLDYTASATALGKPAGADLKLGLSTAPVIFASRRELQLEALMRRRFGRPGDVEAALHLVHKAGGLEETRRLAETHAASAARLAAELGDSPFSAALRDLATAQTSRLR